MKLKVSATLNFTGVSGTVVLTVQNGATAEATENVSATGRVEIDATLDTVVSFQEVYIQIVAGPGVSWTVADALKRS